MMISNERYVTVINRLALLTPFSSVHNNLVDRAINSGQNINERKKYRKLYLFVVYSIYEIFISLYESSSVT